jgi:predicted ester cyclase
MTVEDNKALVRRLFDEVVNKTDLTALDDMIDPAMVLTPDLPRGPEGMKAVVTWLHSVFTNLRYTVEDLVADDDKVAVRLSGKGIQVGEYNGYPGTGKPVAYTEMIFFRIVNQKMQEWWVLPDRFDILQQTGALPVPSIDPSSAIAPALAAEPATAPAAASPARRRGWLWHRA